MRSDGYPGAGGGSQSGKRVRGGGTTPSLLKIKRGWRGMAPVGEVSIETPVRQPARENAVVAGVTI
jgi:hypothetical protein